MPWPAILPFHRGSKTSVCLTRVAISASLIFSVLYQISYWSSKAGMVDQSELAEPLSAYIWRPRYHFDMSMTSG